MSIQIATIRLSKETVSWHDKENNIYLTTPNKLEAAIYDDMALEPIRKGLKYKNIFLLTGEIPPANDYLSTDEEVNVKLKLHIDTHHTNEKPSFSGDYNDLINKPVIPDVDVNKAYVDNAIQTISLTPGPKGDKGDTGRDGLTTSITVNANTYTHSNGTITLPNYPTYMIWTGTQTEYNAIASKDNNTLYFIKE